MAFGLAVVALAMGMCVTLYTNSHLAWAKFGLRFLTGTVWDPVMDEYGALPFVYGTLMSSFLALLIAVPLGVGSALFLAEMAPKRLASVVTFFIELLAAVPSVILGLIGIFVLVPAVKVVQPWISNTFGFLPFFQGTPYGIGLFTAALILALMVLPYITSISRDVILSVPTPLKEAALGLGSTHWEMVRLVILPFARSGIFGSIFLALGRALGETMAVTMVIGNTPKISLSWFDPSYSMAAVIANEFAEATSDMYVHALIAIAFTLFAITVVINGLARFADLSHKNKRTEGRMSRLFARRKLVNNLMFAITGVFTLLAVTSLFAILGYIAYHGFSSLNWDFFTKLPKPLGETGGGIANSIVGSLKVVALAAAMGLPVGVLGALYLAEYGNGKLGFLIRYSADVLNGVPSIVMGIFAYALVVLPMKHFSALSGSVALAIIMIPSVLRTTEEFVRLVPGSIREAALALGVPQWKVVLRVILPTASRGILTGSILAVSRAAGETAPLIFTAFGNRFWDNGMLQPIATLPHTIFTYAIAPYDDWHQQAWAAALILMMVVLIGNIGARLLMRPRRGATR